MAFERLVGAQPVSDPKHHAPHKHAHTRLSLLVFPHAWDGHRLRGSVLLLPAGDPLHAPLFHSGAPFASLSLTLRLVLTPAPSTRTHPPISSTQPGVVTTVIQRPTHPETKRLFEDLHAQFLPTPQPSNAHALAQQRRHRSARLQALGPVVKALPPSYQSAKKRANQDAVQRTTAGLEYLEQDANSWADAAKPRTHHARHDASRHLSWGQVLSHALRQPALARALGLLVDFELDFADLGLTQPQPAWLHATLENSDAHSAKTLAENPTENPTENANPPMEGVVSYAAKLPPLDGRARSLFAAVLFPLDVPLNGPRDEALLREAAAYDDGFARIVHAAQAPQENDDAEVTPRPAPAPAPAPARAPAPCADVGIALAWDDEQLLRWVNRLLEQSRTPNVNAEGAHLHAPVGVAGYRVDVRLHQRKGRQDKTTVGWHSLCGASAELALGAWRTQFTGELWLDVAPHAAHKRKVAGGPSGWHLPRYFAAWRGGSLVLPEPAQQALNGEPQQATNWAALPWPAHLPLPALRYGQQWDFRVRLVDLSGGGPQLADLSVNTTPSSVATLRFLRHAPPKAMRIDTFENTSPAKPPEQDVLCIRRPLLAYPDFGFAGVDAVPALLEQLSGHRNAPRSQQHGLGVSDPDVTHLAISVQVLAPFGDGDCNGDHELDGNPPSHVSLQRDGDHIELFNVLIPLPPRSGFAVNSLRFEEDETALALRLVYTDCADVHASAAALQAASTDGVLMLPTGRHVRLRCRAACVVPKGRRHHFAEALIHTIDAQRVALGAVADLSRRREETNAAGLLASSDATHTTALWLQPCAWPAAAAPEALQAVAQAVALCADGMRLRAQPGHRVLLAATGRMGHVVEHGGSQIRFSSTQDMTGRWLVAHIVCLQRDWTWSGLSEPGIVIESRLTTPNRPMHVVGTLSLPFAVSSVATQARHQQRSHTTFVLFDTIEAADVPGIHDLDDAAGPQTHTWRARARLPAHPDSVSDAQALRLPFARRPRQVPRVVAMGIVPGNDGHDAKNITATDKPSALKSPTLWIEFERALNVHAAHPTSRLKYFARWRCADGGEPEGAPDHSACEALATPQWTAITELSFDHRERRQARERLDAAQDMIQLMPVLTTVHSEAKNVDGTEPTVAVSRWLLALPADSSPLAPAALRGGFLELCTRVASAHWTTPQARFSRIVRVPLGDFF